MLTVPEYAEQQSTVRASSRHTGHLTSTMEPAVPETMRAVRKETASPGYTMAAAHPVPAPVRDEVLIKIDCVAICGSDIALYNWSAVAQVIAKVPFIPGHEAVGTVVR